MSSTQVSRRAKLKNRHFIVIFVKIINEVS
nr:MAG TPA: hypothetical protein [Bacteriophage sp.]DAT80355.1 MAG TPA: hypothetical protein [Bacteriophage sp.]